MGKTCLECSQHGEKFSNEAAGSGQSDICEHCNQEEEGKDRHLSLESTELVERLIWLSLV